MRSRNCPTMPDVPARQPLLRNGPAFDIAWQMFGNTPLGPTACRRSATTCTDHIIFDYHMRGRPRPRGSMEERLGVCRDFAHLAVTLCRAMNIPARYCTGYISDVGLPPPYAPMDFCRMVRSLPGRHLADLRSAQQCAAHRPRADGARPRCRPTSRSAFRSERRCSGVFSRLRAGLLSGAS